MTIQDVKFNLWAVLGFLVLLGASVSGFLYAEQSKVADRQRVVIQDVTTLKANVEHIRTTLDRIVATMEKMDAKLETHRERTEKRITP